MAFGGYTKLFSSILASTIWRETNETRIVFITMLALANADGVVEASVPGLADLARVNLSACEEALQALQQPDPYSRTKDHDGRRIEPVDGGWLLLNHSRYRERVNTEERREYLRVKKQESRARAKAKGDGVNCRQQSSTESTQAEAYAEAEAGKEVQALLRAWNELTTAPLSKVRELSEPRRRAARARLQDRGFEQMSEVFRRINQSPFCRGERGWRASFDWALKPTTITKVLEGNFDREPAPGSPGRTGAAPGKYAALDRSSSTAVGHVS